MIDSEYLNAIILGVIQGIAEFLPISSSGHLVIANEFLQSSSGSKIGQGGFALTLALHIGTLLSILVVYRHDLKQILGRRHLCVGIIAATMPLVAIDLIPSLLDWVEAAFENTLAAGFGLLVTAAVLAVGQRWARDSWSLDELPVSSALLVGLFQAVALIPGVSRSGTTIAGGLLTGLNREAATTFSFLIAIPAISGAACLLILKALKGEAMGTAPGALLLGGAVAFLVGVVALRWLIRLVSQGRLQWFSWYCAAAGTATIAWQLSR